MTPPSLLYMVLTFGAASTLEQGIFGTLEDAEKKAEEIKEKGGEPVIYACWSLERAYK